MPKITTESVFQSATYKQAGLIKYLIELKQGIVLEPNRKYKQFSTNYKGYPDVKSFDIEQASRIIEHLQGLPDSHTVMEKPNEEIPVELIQPEKIVANEDDIL